MITMEIKLKTRDRLELDVLDSYIPETKDIKIQTEDYVLDGKIIMDEISQEFSIHEIELTYIFLGKLGRLKKRGVKRDNYEV